MKKILVLGKGYLGKEFERQGFEVLDKDKFNYPTSLIKPPKEVVDSDIIINCIAKSNTRWCEQHENLYDAISINGYFPHILSAYCKDYNKKFVHISTGCLYDRTDRENYEDEFIAAHCNYTVSKWIGESGLNLKRDLILRPRLLYSDTEDRNNLLCKLPKYEFYVYDQLDSLTCTSTIVEATKALLDHDTVGIFNIAQEGSASILDLATWCDLFNGKTIKMDELRFNQQLYLVNNVMNIDKLKHYYKPENLKDSIKKCWNKLGLIK
jgi:dTDP-4-dehydrorhamnose reductase